MQRGLLGLQRGLQRGLLGLQRGLQRGLPRVAAWPPAVDEAEGLLHHQRARRLPVVVRLVPCRG